MPIPQLANACYDNFMKIPFLFNTHACIASVKGTPHYVVVLEMVWKERTADYTISEVISIETLKKQRVVARDYLEVRRSLIKKASDIVSKRRKKFKFEQVYKGF